MRAIQLLVVIFLLIVSYSCNRKTSMVNLKENSHLHKEFNYLGKNKTGYINLNSGTNIKTRYLELAGQNISYKEIYSDSLLFMTTDSIKHIYFKDHFIGGMDGFLIGFGSGAGLYILVGDECGSCHPNLSGLGYLIGGTIVGIPVGVITGSKLIYNFK